MWLGPARDPHSEKVGAPQERPLTLGIVWHSAFLLLERAWAPAGMGPDTAFLTILGDLVPGPHLE